MIVQYPTIVAEWGGGGAKFYVYKDFFFQQNNGMDDSCKQ